MLAIPKYLKDIETKLQVKLTSLKRPQSDLFEHQQIYHDSVLEIYQEAFINLIECTATYSNFLNNVKNAYDKAIQVRDKRISQLITQDKTFGISVKKKQRDDKTKALLLEIEELKKQNLKLTFDFSKLKKEMGKLKDEQFSEYLCLMRERDARYTLYFENVALQLKLKELDGSSCSVEQAHGDPVVLRIALDRCREQLSAAQSEVKSLREEYADTVPRREHSALEARLAETGAELAAAHAGLASLHDAHHKLQESNKRLEEEVREVRERCGELERAGTPRPHWNICGDFISGGRDRWYQLSAGLSSQETLRALLKELGPAAHSDHLEYFQGLGSEGSVPAYLRWEGRVRNMRLSRRELCALIADIWRGKETHAHTTMQDYLHLYFQERYEQPSVRAEWAYNLCAGIEQALDEPAAGVLWAALHHPPAERRYWALRGQWRALGDRAASAGEVITMEELEKCCRAVFPLKSEVEIRGLCEAARRQLKLRGSTHEINVHKLFEENEEGFLRVELGAELCRQRDAAAARYVRELVAALGGRRARTTLVAVDALRRALATIDPAIDHVRMEQYVRLAFADGRSPLHAVAAAPLYEVARRLVAADVERADPRYRARHHTRHR